MGTGSLQLGGKHYVIVEREEYDRLATLAKAGALPPVPTPDADGNVPAAQLARASLARKIIRERVAIGMTQRELAELAGIRPETLNRLEHGRHTPSIPTIQNIDRVLKRRAAELKAKKGGR